MKAERLNDKRIINVSNRLPVKISMQNSKATFKQSEGGLATGLNSIFGGSNNIWIGWPGAVVEAADHDDIIHGLNKQNLFPLFLSQEEIDNYYAGFANETLWPLFHYFTTYSSYRQHCYDCYVSVNQKFADEVIKLAKADDIIWIHDYQLMLVPAMIRERLPDITIGYFQHIPFPDYEVYRSLPWKKEIINGLLGADTIGFQTEDDVKHFLSSANRLLDCAIDNGRIIADDRIVAVQAFPISIDYEKFRMMAMQEDTDRKAADIMDKIKTKLAISVDRLDYSKGIIQRLKAFNLFLQKYPEWHHKITLVHLVVPSRDTVNNYCELKEEMDRLISNINGKHGTFGWQPIRHFYQSFDANMLSALYKTADLALVTPLRDGMNLVSKEFVASNISKNGMLLLGEAAGAAQELTDAIIVNPNDIHDFADKIYEGLSMPLKERQLRMGRMQQKISDFDIFKWSSSFIAKLQDSVSKRLQAHMVKDYEMANRTKQRNAVVRKRLLLYKLLSPSPLFSKNLIHLVLNKGWVLNG